MSDHAKQKPLSLISFDVMMAISINPLTINLNITHYLELSSLSSSAIIYSLTEWWFSDIQTILDLRDSLEEEISTTLILNHIPLFQNVRSYRTLKEPSSLFLH